MEEKLKAILTQIKNHESRIIALESGAVPNKEENGGRQKKRTLREIIKGKKFKNGQEQVAIIVGYFEKINGELIKKDALKSEWITAKMIRKYHNNFIERAKEDLIRIYPNGECDLTQSGEEFFENFLNEPNIQTS